MPDIILCNCAALSSIQSAFWALLSDGDNNEQQQQGHVRPSGLPAFLYVLLWSHSGRLFTAHRPATSHYLFAAPLSPKNGPEPLSSSQRPGSGPPLSPFSPCYAEWACLGPYAGQLAHQHQCSRRGRVARRVPIVPVHSPGGRGPGYILERHRTAAIIPSRQFVRSRSCPSEFRVPDT